MGHNKWPIYSHDSEDNQMQRVLDMKTYAIKNLYQSKFATQLPTNTWLKINILK